MPKVSFQESKQVTIQSLATRIHFQLIYRLRLVFTKHIFYTWQVIIKRLELPIPEKCLSM